MSSPRWQHTHFIRIVSPSRYCAVTSPLHYSMTITRGRSVRLIVGVWTLALLYALPQLLAHTYAHLRPASRLSACPSGERSNSRGNDRSWGGGEEGKASSRLPLLQPGCCSSARGAQQGHLHLCMGQPLLIQSYGHNIAL
ncbi:hypothetical protein E2C01_047809 [Portunus trituberculatus]|uniref:G-protein coupled receptors family 1 profile domain-containing protein n=1 Tax=Portunus trituberculatus TaxID=210409 RepID=A0A5B7G8W0_PORTR|nr:hypothetical protein [Portunus trituberculatus]